MERDYWGSCIVIVGRHTTAGMPPFSFALPAANLPASRAQHQVRPHLFRRKAVGCRQGDPPRKAGQHRAGEKLASIFLCYRPFVLRAFW